MDFYLFNLSVFFFSILTNNPVLMRVELKHWGDANSCVATFSAIETRTTVCFLTFKPGTRAFPACLTLSQPHLQNGQYHDTQYAKS